MVSTSTRWSTLVAWLLAAVVLAFALSSANAGTAIPLAARVAAAPAAVVESSRLGADLSAALLTASGGANDQDDTGSLARHLLRAYGCDERGGVGGTWKPAARSVLSNDPVLRVETELACGCAGLPWSWRRCWSPV